MLVLTFISLFYNCVVSCYGHFAQKCLWHFQGDLCACATRWASPVQRWNGGVVCFRGKPLWGSTRKIWKRFHWHSARFCKYMKWGPAWWGWFWLENRADLLLVCTELFFFILKKRALNWCMSCSKPGEDRPHAEDSLLYSQNFKSLMIDFSSRDVNLK